MGGTKKAMAKLLIQLLNAPIEAPLARIERGKISETSVHETGPQVAPKPAMYSQIRAASLSDSVDEWSDGVYLPTAVQPAATWPGQSCWNLATITPTITMLLHMTIEPPKSMGLRPILSMTNWYC
jgi:hypothetical protein